MNNKLKIFLLWFLGIVAVISFADVPYVAYCLLQETGEFHLKWSSLFASLALLSAIISIKRGDFDNLINRQGGKE
ncbi:MULTISPECIES: hypothetical protein [Bacillaceae]|uniref:Uncharacterized protein n=1 Tax=Evansella alkalicola TaxID=745819 RepID=A0ABS6JSW9_9BACI|nr:MULTISPECIES: hypothetical protein [Bacillaceae]MBU9721654.1 hypothetical protein [Bacillus alkalicola]